VIESQQQLRTRYRGHRLVYAIVSPTHWLPAVAVLWAVGGLWSFSVAWPAALAAYLVLAVRSYVRTKTADRLARHGMYSRHIALDEGRAELRAEDLAPEIARRYEAACAAGARLREADVGSDELGRLEIAIERAAWRAERLVWEEPPPPALTAGLAELDRLPGELGVLGAALRGRDRRLISRARAAPTSRRRAGRWG
jgi:hypothetical protein